MGWPTREELPETCTRDGGSLSEGETCSGPAAWHGHRAPTSASSLPDSPAGPPGRASSPRTSILITSPQGCPIPASPNPPPPRIWPHTQQSLQIQLLSCSWLPRLYPQLGRGAPPGPGFEVFCLLDLHIPTVQWGLMKNKKLLANK